MSRLILLILLMLRSRWAQALILGALSVIATASAVAVPAYLGAVDRAVVHREVSGASAEERSMSIAVSVRKDAEGGGVPDFSLIGSALISMPGFSPVFATETPVLGVSGSAISPSRFVYRQDLCGHLVMVSGRCLVGGSEVLLGQRTAQRLGVRPGVTVTVRYAEVDQQNSIYVPVGAPDTLTVVGVYRVPDPGALYWGDHGYFATDATGGPAEPVFAGRSTFAALDHIDEQDAVDVQATGAAFAPDNLDTMRGGMIDVEGRVTALSDQVAVLTAIPKLLDRIDRSRALAHQVVPVAGIPLVVLAWFVIFLAVGYGTEGRRFELGLAAMRGTGRPTRWALAAGEPVVAIVLGALVGYPVGLFATAALAAARLDGAGSGIATADTLWYAVAAAAGAVLAALLAQVRQLRAPVAQLLRRVSGGAGRWRSLALEAIVVLCAVVAAVQLRVAGGQLAGLGMLVPGLVILAVALLGGRAVVPLASRYGARALRRGRSGAALAALQLGRRPGSHRLFVLLVGALALLGFATAAVNVAGKARTERAQIDAGAPRVLTVNPVTRLKLLAATRAVDPAGRYAMAVVQGPAGAPGDPPQIAVDTTRLAAVATWRNDFGPHPARLSALLRPGLSDPTVIRGRAIELDVTSDVLARVGETDLAVTLAPLSGAPPVGLDLGRLVEGDQTMVSQVDACAQGCRLVGFGAVRGGAGGFELHLTLRQVRTVEPAAVVFSAAQLADASRWRPQLPDDIGLSGDPAGLHIDFHSADGTRAENWIHPADRPASLPVAATVALPSGTRLVGLDGLSAPVTEVVRVAGLPRLGGRGVLVDLEYADRSASDAGSTNIEQVWLGPGAPADVVGRLGAQGVVVTGDSGVAALGAELDGQGPAMAVWFHLLAGMLAVLIGVGGVRLVAAVDRDRRAGDLRALRNQGLSRRVAARAALWGYLVVVLAAALVGLVAAAVAWSVAGADIPTSVDPSPLWPAPRWPDPAAVAWPWASAVAILVGVALVAAYDLRRRVRQYGRFERSEEQT